MRKSARLIVLVSLAWFAVAVTASTGKSLTQVATLDGTPVYHWRTFKSALPDDVDRALVLREFQRKQFKVPQKLVDDAVRTHVKEKFGGDPNKFAQSLREQGASPNDFKRFIREEIIIQAMLYKDTRKVGDQAQTPAQWLAGLREGAKVERLPAESQDKR